MKLTATQLRRIIREEVKRVMNENVEQRVAEVLGILESFAVDYGNNGGNNTISEEDLEAEGVTQADLKLVQDAYDRGEYDSQQYYIQLQEEPDGKITVFLEDPLSV
jgi:hypothetical protein